MPKFDHVRRGLCLLSATVAAPPAYARSGGAESVIIFVGTVIALGIAFWVIGSVIRSRVDERVRVEMQVRLHQITERERQAQEQIAFETERYRQLKAVFDRSYVDGRRWLAKFIADAFRSADDAVAQGLTNKRRAAHRAADEVRSIAAEKRELRVQAKQLEYTLKMLYEYYPLLEEYAEDILNEEASVVLEEGEDPEGDRVIRYISREEYERLTPVARNQLALDK